MWECESKTDNVDVVQCCERVSSTAGSVSGQPGHDLSWRLAGAGGAAHVHQGWKKVRDGAVSQWLQTSQCYQQVNFKLSDAGHWFLFVMQRHQSESSHHQWKNGGHQHLSLGRGQSWDIFQGVIKHRNYFFLNINHHFNVKATKEDSPGERHLYKVTDFQSGQPGLVTCLSCDELNTRFISN